jgi:hypothetical protein
MPCRAVLLLVLCSTMLCRAVVCCASQCCLLFGAGASCCCTSTPQFKPFKWRKEPDVYCLLTALHAGASCCCTTTLAMPCCVAAWPSQPIKEATLCACMRVQGCWLSRMQKLTKYLLGRHTLALRT